jgi:hypothetical protein
VAQIVGSIMLSESKIHTLVFTRAFQCLNRQVLHLNFDKMWAGILEMVVSMPQSAGTAFERPLCRRNFHILSVSMPQSAGTAFEHTERPF